MVARIPVGLSASAVMHAVGLALLVLIPVLEMATLPETRIPWNGVFVVPLVPHARTPPADPVRPRGGRFRRASPSAVYIPVAIPVAQVVPAVPQSEGDPFEGPTDSAALCLGCSAAAPGE